MSREDDAQGAFAQMSLYLQNKLLDIAERALRAHGSDYPSPEEIEDLAVVVYQKLVDQFMPTDDMVRQIMQDEFERHKDPETLALSEENYVEAEKAILKRLEELGWLSWSLRKTQEDRGEVGE